MSRATRRTRRRVTVFLGALAAIANAAPATAQWRGGGAEEASTWPRYETPSPQPEVANTSGAKAAFDPNDSGHARALGMGLLGSALGVVVGGYAGYHLEPACTCEYPGLMGLFVGASVGSALVTPVFTHSGNHGRGSLGAGLAVTAATEVFFLGLGELAGVWEPTLLLPLVHWISAFSVELATEPNG